MGRPVILVTAAALLLFVATAGAARITAAPALTSCAAARWRTGSTGRGGNDRIKVDGGGRDTVRCGTGRYDLVNADLADRVAADCETVARVVARDLYRSTAQHSSIAEPDSFAWGNTVVAAFQSGRFRDGGAVNTGWATSRDGGRTWRSGTLPSLTVNSRPAGRWQRASDPVVAYDAAHGTWLIASLALTSGEAAAVVVSRSPDGITWSAPFTVIEAPWQPNLLLDKEWIVCDNGVASPHRGSCYATYSDFRTRRLEFQASRDGGVTWGAQVAAPGDAGRRSIDGRWAPAPQPVVQPDGDLIVPYYDEDRVASVRSADGGRSFSAPVTVSPTAFKATPGLRAPPLPSTEVDANGVVYVVWPDCRPTPSCRADQLVISRSSDGISWSPATSNPHGSADFGGRLRAPRNRSRPDTRGSPGGRLLRRARRRAPRRRLHLVAERRPYLATAQTNERPDDAPRMGRPGRRRDARRLLLHVVDGWTRDLGLHARLVQARCVRPAALRRRDPSLIARRERQARPALWSCA